MKKILPFIDDERDPKAPTIIELANIDTD